MAVGLQKVLCSWASHLLSSHLYHVISSHPIPSLQRPEEPPPSLPSLSTATLSSPWREAPGNAIRRTQAAQSLAAAVQSPAASQLRLWMRSMWQCRCVWDWRTSVCDGALKCRAWAALLAPDGGGRFKAPYNGRGRSIRGAAAGHAPMSLCGCHGIRGLVAAAQVCSAWRRRPRVWFSVVQRFGWRRRPTVRVCIERT